MASKFIPGMPVRPLNPFKIPPWFGWYNDQWCFHISTEAQAPDRIAIRPSIFFKDQIVIHLQVCRYAQGVFQNFFACWQWEEDFELDNDLEDNQQTLSTSKSSVSAFLPPSKLR